METNIFGLVKKNFRVARVHKKMARVGSGWPKWPRVGSNLGSGFDPTHPYACMYFMFYGRYLTFTMLFCT